MVLIDHWLFRNDMFFYANYSPLIVDLQKVARDIPCLSPPTCKKLPGTFHVFYLSFVHIFFFYIDIINDIITAGN